MRKSAIEAVSLAIPILHIRVLKKKLGLPVLKAGEIRDLISARLEIAFDPQPAGRRMTMIQMAGAAEKTLPRMLFFVGAVRNIDVRLSGEHSL